MALCFSLCKVVLYFLHKSHIFIVEYLYTLSKRNANFWLSSKIPFEILQEYQFIIYFFSVDIQKNFASYRWVI